MKITSIKRKALETKIETEEGFKFKLHIGGVNVSGGTDIEVLKPIHSAVKTVIPRIPFVGGSYDWPEWFKMAEKEIVKVIESI
jgi:hypothetical protein